MTVELRYDHSIGEFVCEFGAITNSAPDVDPYGVEPQPLMLITADYVAQLESGAKPEYRGATTSLTVGSDGRKFVHLERNDGMKWTWELHPANWWDGGAPKVYVGRWPD